MKKNVFYYCMMYFLMFYSEQVLLCNKIEICNLQPTRRYCSFSLEYCHSPFSCKWRGFCLDSCMKTSLKTEVRKQTCRPFSDCLHAHYSFLALFFSKLKPPLLLQLSFHTHQLVITYWPTTCSTAILLSGVKTTKHLHPTQKTR